ncbi:L,D-transpeptidase [Waddlia chondrophila]|uniref:L,D-TPase catalytic domain-containing protein n=1 Tax=Waddlia chondrophila (strain ATCC VR-1470 / WSU 86-1044) TaxID=716544 RepID=D6YRI9_WADCW|nr:L,D-transpeptidase [Waddlia chondrophila]ADI38684.1 conserved hypothetical protein [Waddlia chondrophila WSU 86-1044]
MSFPKLLAIITVLLFGSIAIAAIFKKKEISDPLAETEIVLAPVSIEEDPLVTDAVKEEKSLELLAAASTEETAQEVPEADRIDEFFNTRGQKFPIVETITYKKKVPWLKGRAAWIADYASHYKTSRHFIARSLNGKPLYDKQDVVDGDRFNVFKEDKNLSFYLLVDLQRSKMWFYYLDEESNDRVLVKTYQVGLGRLEKDYESGSLTPLGKYSLGEKVAVYRPKTMGFHQGDKVEMVRIFGTRWIPFEEELDHCTAPAKGFGIHGLPLMPNAKGELVENSDTLGKYESDGCIRLATKDMEELFSVIITKPAVIEIVKNFHDAKLPGKESRG